MKTFLPSLRRFAAFLSFSCLLLFASGSALAQSTPWLGVRQTGGSAYFFFANRVERYAVADREWLSPIALPAARGNATAAWADAEGLYVTYGQALYRYALNGTGETALLNATSSVNAGGLISNASYLYAVYGGSSILSIRKSNNTVVQNNTSSFYSFSGISIAPVLGKMFGRTTGVSPSDIVAIPLAADGTTGPLVDSPHHGSYPSATKTWVFPNEGRVVDSAGIVYGTGNITYLASFGSAISDLQFLGTDVPIVLNGNRLTAYTNSLLPTGSTVLAFTPQNILLDATDILCFTPDSGQAGGIRVNVVAQSLLSPPLPGQPVNPVGLPFTPTSSFLDKDGILYLYSKAQMSLFRWNPATQQYLTTIPLIGAADFVAYSPANHRVYTAYTSGLIRKIDLADPTFAETPFANLPMAPLGLSTAGAYCFASDASGAWNTHYTFNAAGTLIDSVEWNYYSTEYIWSEGNQKMYFFRDDTSPNDLIWEEINANGIAYPGEVPGGIRNMLDSPLHESLGWTHPIRVSPDGSVVVLGSGLIHNASTLARLSTALANTITDAAWLAGELRTTRSISTVTQFQQWLAPNYTQGTVRQVPGTAHRLLTLDASRQVAVTIAADGVPSLYILNSAFQVVAPPTLAAPAGLTGAATSTVRIDLAWQDVTGEEGYAVERKIGVGGVWSSIGTTTVGLTAFADTSIVVGSTYFYRVIATNGALQSAPSAEISVAVTAPATPATLTATAVSTTEILVTWGDVANEANFVLERKIGPAGTWATIATLGINVVSYSNTSLGIYTQYFYRVRATNGVGNSGYSNEASATTFAIPPAATSIYTSSVTANSATLYWNNVNYEDNYVLERRASPAGAWSTVTSPGVNVTSYTDNTVAASTAYDYRIKAVNIAGESAWSAIYTVSTPAPPPPATPTGLAIQVLSATSLRILWTDVANETGYRLERRTDGPVVWTVVGTLGANETSYTDNGLTTGVEYIYRLAAFNTADTSAWSVEISAAPFAVGSLVNDDFDPGVDSTNWQSITAGAALDGGAGFRGSNALWFGGAGLRAATTIPLDLSVGGTVRFFFRAGNTAVDGATYWENSETGESIVLEYSTGSGWTTLQTFTTVYPSASTWSSYTISAPIAARSPQTAFRWRQLTHSGASFDTWALDDVVVEGAIPAPPTAPAFVISSPVSDISVAVFWQPVSGARSYIVERLAAGGIWLPLAVTPSTANFHTDTACLPESWYGYRVRAVNLGGTSPASTPVFSQTYGQFDAWRLANFAQVEPTGAAAPLVPDADGVVNLLKYAFNLNVGTQSAPLVRDSGTSGLPVCWIDPIEGRLCVEFIRRRSAYHPGVTYQVEFSDDCATWTPGGRVLRNVAINPLWERLCVADDVAVAPRFVRVRISEP